MQEITISDLSGGICLSDLDYKLADNQSPSMLNMWYSDRVLNKRWGQEINMLIGENDSILNIHQNTYNGYGIIHAGTNLYKWDITNATFTGICNTLNSTEGKKTFFEYSNNLYYLDGSKYWTINSNFVCSEVTPTIPIVLIGCTPNLTNSTPYQDYNLIGSGFTAWYNSDGTNKYKLPQTELSNTSVTATVNGTNYNETTHFTVDRTNGTLTWNTNYVPTNGGVIDGVRITAYKDDSTAKAKISNCTIATPFGGEGTSLAGGTRIFVSGNTNYPTTYWRSGLKDPAYFPETEYDLLDNNNQKITAFSKQYSELIILKEKSIYSLNYSFDGTNVRFPTKELNAEIGCDVPDSVQLIDNRTVFFNTYKGGFLIDRTDSTDEKNIKPISNNINGTDINPGILAETDLTKAKSVDFGRKYWIALPNGKAWIWDYDISPYVDTGDYAQNQRNLKWFPMDTIEVGAFFAKNQTLYMGMSTYDAISKFITTLIDYRPLTESDKAINAHWQSKAFDFNMPQFYKTINDVVVMLRSDTNTQVTIEYLDEEHTVVDTDTLTVGDFSWRKFSWDVFTWGVYNYAKPKRLRCNIKRVMYFAIKFSNSSMSRDLGIASLSMTITKNGKVK